MLILSTLIGCSKVFNQSKCTAQIIFLGESSGGCKIIQHLKIRIEILPRFSDEFVIWSRQTRFTILVPWWGWRRGCALRDADLQRVQPVQDDWLGVRLREADDLAGDVTIKDSKIKKKQWGNKCHFTKCHFTWWKKWLKLSRGWMPSQPTQNDTDLIGVGREKNLVVFCFTIIF